MLKKQKLLLRAATTDYNDRPLVRRELIGGLICYFFMFTQCSCGNEASIFPARAGTMLSTTDSVKLCRGATIVFLNKTDNRVEHF